MRKEVYTIGRAEFIRVDKTEARKYFENGGMVYLAPCNLDLYNPWIIPITIQKDFVAYYGNNNFDDLVNNYEYYNCCKELGKYAKFFIVNYITD